MKTAAKPRMIYQTDETRSKILVVARNLFTEKGLFDTQMLDIATAMGMSRTTLYRYFQDKLDLALAIVAILMEEIQNAWDDPGPGPGRTARDRVGLYLKRVWVGPGPYSAHLRYFAEFDAFFLRPDPRRLQGKDGRFPAQGGGPGPGFAPGRGSGRRLDPGS